MKNKIFILLFLLLNTFAISQQKSMISGKIIFDNKIIKDAIVELKINQISRFAVSNELGIYKFLNIEFLPTDILILKLKYNNCNPFNQELKNLSANNIIDIKLIEIQTEKLNDVIVNNQNKTKNTAKKSSYKIDSKGFIKNAKAPEVLSSIPNVYVNENAVIVDGKIDSKIFIDGVEDMIGEIKNIDATDIEKIEVMNNPSSVYGTDFTGAVINVITKKKSDEFLKGSIGKHVGTRNNFWYIDPFIAYKKGNFVIKSNYEYKRYAMIQEYDLYRNNNNSIIFQKFLKVYKGIQNNSQTRINVIINNKSNLTFTNSIYTLKFLDDTNGFSRLNNETPNSYKKIGESFFQNLKIATVYSYKINDLKNFFVKIHYSVFENKDSNNFIFGNNTTNYYIIQSKNKEFSINLDYEVEELTIFKKKMGFFSDFKFINRDFSFTDTDFFINQNIFNTTNELDTEWNDKFSTQASITLENTNNRNFNLNQSYNLVLPTINALYHFKNKLDFKVGYSRKVLRPSASDLNDAILIINPNIAKQGNSNLDPQIRNYYSLTFSKIIKSNNFSLKFYDESINNAIEEVYKSQGNLLVQTLSNTAKFNSLGMILGIKTKIFKKININLNSGFDYNVYEDNSISSVIKSNQGYTFRENFYLSTKLFRDKASLSFSGRQFGPNYSLLSKTINNPYLDFNFDYNIFDSKVKISVYGQNLLGKFSNVVEISSYNNFYQRTESRNNSSNLIFSLTYNFGKKFNDKIEDNNIQNDDIRK